MPAAYLCTFFSTHQCRAVNCCKRSMLWTDDGEGIDKVRTLYTATYNRQRNVGGNHFPGLKEQQIFLVSLVNYLNKQLWAGRHY